MCTTTLLSLYSCNDEVSKTFESKPVAMARMNEIVAIADKDMWEGPMQDTFNFYFQSAYPIIMILNLELPRCSGET
jgi:hypothetical protein